MKVLAVTALACALSAVSISPTLTGPAMSQTNVILERGQISGQVESIDGSSVMVRTSNGSLQMYRIDPTVISTLKLNNGSTILINNLLMTGVITDINRNDLQVDLDNGGERNFVVPEVERGTLAAGDRVVITPDQRVIRLKNYLFTARDIRLIYPVASIPMTVTRTVERTVVQESVPRQTVERTLETPAPTYSQPAPVRALW